MANDREEEQLRQALGALRQLDELEVTPASVRDRIRRRAVELADETLVEPVAEVSLAPLLEGDAHDVWETDAFGTGLGSGSPRRARRWMAVAAIPVAAALVVLVGLIIWTNLPSDTEAVETATSVQSPPVDSPLTPCRALAVVSANFDVFADDVGAEELEGGAVDLLSIADALDEVIDDLMDEQMAPADSAFDAEPADFVNAVRQAALYQQVDNFSAAAAQFNAVRFQFDAVVDTTGPDCRGDG